MNKVLALVLLSLLIVHPAYAADSTYTKAYTWFLYGDSSRNLSAKVDALGDASTELDIPVSGVKQSDLSDTWGDARAHGRIHEGIDIIAPRGTSVISPTDAVVTHIGYGSVGGNYIYTANPGKESYYYAHLDRVADGLTVGEKIEKGKVIGYVGNTGNASGGAPHLHFTIYTRESAVNPYPRLMGLELSNVKAEATATKPAAVVESTAVQQENISDKKSVYTRNLTLGMKGEDVRALQQFLIAQKKGPAAKVLSTAGATGTFGPVTKRALIEYQKSVGITPASGVFGSLTRAYIAT